MPVRNINEPSRALQKKLTQIQLDKDFTTRYR